MQDLKITLAAAGKKFRQQWLFKNLNLTINAGDRLAVTGYNGTGKSTLLQIIAGYHSLNTGVITFIADDKIIPVEFLYKYISCAAPYIDLPEELTLEENVEFYRFHKKVRNNITVNEIIQRAELLPFKERQLKYFSSGMKQRVRLILAFSADVPLLLLDEPLSNLDQNGKDWYHQLLNAADPSQTIVICSNHQADEIAVCTRTFDLAAFAERML